MGAGETTLFVTPRDKPVFVHFLQVMFHNFYIFIFFFICIFVYSLPLKKKNKTNLSVPKWQGSYWSYLLIITAAAAAAAKSLQSGPTLCDPIDGSPPGSPVPGILQARILEWVAISFSNAWRWKVKVKSLSRVRLWVTPWTAAYRAPPSMGFSRQEYWSGT